MLFDNRDDEWRRLNESGFSSVSADDAAGANSVGSITSANASRSSSPKGTNWTNLQKYLDVNQGEGGRMAGDVGAKTAEEASAVANDIWGYSKGVTSGLQSAPSYIGSSIFNDPTKIDQKTFSQFWDPKFNADSYDLSYGMDGINAARDRAESSESVDGISALAGQYLGRPTYTQGERGLDSILMAGDGTIKDTLSSQSSNLEKSAQGAYDSYSAALAAKNAQIASVRDRFRDDFNNAYDKISNDRNSLRSNDQFGARQEDLARAKQLDADLEALSNLAGKSFTNVDWEGLANANAMRMAEERGKGVSFTPQVDNYYPPSGVYKGSGFGGDNALSPMISENMLGGRQVDQGLGVLKSGEQIVREPVQRVAGSGANKVGATVNRALSGKKMKF